MTIQTLAAIALVLYGAYGIAFFGEGLKAQGSRGTKTLGTLAELAFLSALVWTVFWT